MPREVIQFNGHPVQVRLDQAPAAVNPRENENGVYFQHIVNGNTGIMFLRPEAHSQLIKLGAHAGEEISIQRIRRGRSWGWDVHRVTAQPAPQPQTRTATEPAKPAEQPSAPASSPATAATQAPTAFSSLSGCLCAAIDAAAEAQAYAARKNIAVQFHGEDIRALALTLYVKGGK